MYEAIAPSSFWAFFRFQPRRTHPSNYGLILPEAGLKPSIFHPAMRGSTFFPRR
jgi:hypothetical protein